MTAIVTAAARPSIPTHLTERLRSLRDALLTGLVERDVAIRLALLSVCAGEHLLLIGPPGTAKSLVARRLRMAFADATCFERLLTRFTVPEELFGPLSLKGLEDDRYERLTKGYLPAASVAFLDEIFKANSAILNALLTLLNERAFDNGTERVEVPLLGVVGASNELPEGEELDALYDRFLLRLHVGPVSASGFRDLLGLRGECAPSVPAGARLTADDLAAIRRAADEVDVPEEVLALLVDLRDFCAAEGIEVSDRRWRKVVKLLQVSALTNSRSEVSIWDGWLLQHCLWSTPEDREKVATWYEARVGAAAAMDPTRLVRVVGIMEARLKRDRDARSQALDGDGKPLFLTESGKRTKRSSGPARQYRDGEPLLLAPANAHRPVRSHFGPDKAPVESRDNDGKGFTEEELDQLYVSGGYHAQQFEVWGEREAYLTDRANWLMKDDPRKPVMEPTAHPVAYIAARLTDVNELIETIGTYRARLDEHLEGLEELIEDHLWVTDDFFEPARTSLDTTRHTINALSERVEKLRRGWDRLPCANEEPLADLLAGGEEA